MNVQFISQGFDKTKNVSAGQSLIDSLVSPDFKSFFAFSAFVQGSGLRHIMRELTAFKTRGGVIKFYLGVDLLGTSKDALESLLLNGLETYIVHSPNRITYHPKIYLFQGDTKSKIIIGSSNLTSSGLFLNIEASTIFDFDNTDPAGAALLRTVLDNLDAFIRGTHPNCKILDHNLLTLLVDNKIVVTEADRRAKNNKLNKEVGKVDLTKKQNLEAIFAPLSSIKPPLGFSNIIRKEIFTVETDDTVNVESEDVVLQAGAMWCETRAMTGGSGNILDLSMTGKKSGGGSILGSVTFFNIDPDDGKITKTFSIHHGGEIYQNNLILFTPDNGTWRMQIKGESAGGKRLTTISHLGGLKRKVLVFSRIDNDNYALDILSESELESLKEKSTAWGTNGISGNGKSYGFI